MGLKRKYLFTCCQLSIFTWNLMGCKLELTANFQITPYFLNNTVMSEYLNVNMSLDNMRRLARGFTGKIPITWLDGLQPNIDEEFSKILPSVGPRVLVIGSQDSGKTTLCQ